MELERLFSIVQGWMNGQITEVQRQELKALYIAEVGEPSGCIVCPGFWEDVRHHFRYQLKQNGYYTMSTKKYIIAGREGIFFHYATGKGYANEGPFNPNRLELTDEVAEQILKINPDLKSQIIANPDYKTPEQSRAERAAKAVENLKAESTKAARTPRAAKATPPAPAVETSTATEENQ